MYEMLFKNGYKKALTVSYDDGLPADVRLKNIFDKYGIKCTFNINSSLMLPDGAEIPKVTTRENMWTRMRMSDYVRLFKESGHEIAIHGLTHNFPDRLSEEEALKEYLEDKKALEATFETVIRGCAYAMGTYNENCKKVLRDIGIHYSRTIKPTYSFGIPRDRFELEPTCHHNEDCVGLAKKFIADDTPPSKLFYLWGHSCEFDIDGNWDVIEEFADIMGTQNDIWFATNIEVFDYIDAYERLEFASDGKFVFNPNAIDIWFTDGEKTYKAVAGKVTSLK